MQIIKDSLKTITISLITISLISIAYAWTEPTSNPPNGNVSAPINTSSTSQYKSGALGVGGLLRAYSNLQVDGNITAGGQSVITSLAAGSGISISGSGNSRTITNTASGLTGSGTTNYIAKWTGGTSLGNSMISDDGSKVGIGIGSPQAKLHVGGDIRGNLGIATVVVECWGNCADEGTPNQICQSAFGSEWKALSVDCECVEAPGANTKLKRYWYNNLDWCCDTGGEDFTVSCYVGS